ncbi:hypothetical protein CDL15_Pgr022198 [Punica granatum]|uniref:Uncharacterized protein n=1 Tax=Punica granatum TaxID=22663 RepID=A0A218VT00_PUNGR|nr:hypothetical protein CDL15_Pgr022198 [Punica granatum]
MHRHAQESNEVFTSSKIPPGLKELIQFLRQGALNIVDMPNYTGFGKVKKLLKNASKFYADYHLEVVRWLKELHRLAYSLKADLARGVDCKDIANMKRQATAELALSQQTLTGLDQNLKSIDEYEI